MCVGGGGGAWGAWGPYGRVDAVLMLLRIKQHTSHAVRGEPKPGAGVALAAVSAVPARCGRLAGRHYAASISFQSVACVRSACKASAVGGLHQPYSV